MPKTRFIPSNYVQFNPEPLNASYGKGLFACYVHRDKSIAMFFIGKRSGASWHCSFKDNDSLKKKIIESISQLMSWEDSKLKRKEDKKKEVSEVKIGDIFSYSWGYDQTNVDFYQVTEVKGKTFVIREIGRTSCGEAPSGSMSDYIIAKKDSFTGLPILKRSLNMKFGMLSKTDDKKKHFVSWYA